MPSPHQACARRLAATSLAAIAVSACTGGPGPDAEPTPRTRSSTVVAPPAARTPPGCVVNTALPNRSIAATMRPMPGTAASIRALAALPVAPRERGTDFCRAAFGPDTWPDLDGNGCSARQDTLRRQARRVRLGVIRSHSTGCHEVLGGTWIDAYTGAVLTGANMKDPRTAGTIQIDHVVSLFDAWVSGARTWPPAKRVQFANDTSVHELYAVAAQTNFDKSYRSVESWQPAPAARCRVARAVVEVKTAYGLSVTAGERDALASMLHTC